MAASSGQPLQVGVLLGDPRFPYPYSQTGSFGTEELEAVEWLRKALDELSGYAFLYFDDHERLIDDLRTTPLDLVLNLCDTGYRNNWDLERDVPALLEILDLPYTGSDPLAISLSTDKAIVRSLAFSLDIPVPNEVFVDLSADPLTLPMSYPALIKPNNSGGSFGITHDSVVADALQAEAYMRWLAPQLMSPEAVIQDFLTGPEYTVGLIGNRSGGFTVLEPLEIDYGGLAEGLPPLLTYGSKSDPESPYWQMLEFKRAELDEVTFSQMVDHCAKLFHRLSFRDYGRFDFRAGADGVPRLLDANTNPTWYWDGKMAMMSEWKGLSYADMMQKILDAAAARYGFLAVLAPLATPLTAAFSGSARPTPGVRTARRPRRFPGWRRGGTPRRWR